MVRGHGIDCILWSPLLGSLLHMFMQWLFFFMDWGSSKGGGGFSIPPLLFCGLDVERGIEGYFRGWRSERRSCAPSCIYWLLFRVFSFISLRRVTPNFIRLTWLLVCIWGWWDHLILRTFTWVLYMLLYISRRFLILLRNHLPNLFRRINYWLIKVSKVLGTCLPQKCSF